MPRIRIALEKENYTGVKRQMINIRNKNEKKGFSQETLLSCLAEDLAYENKCLMGIISDFNQIVEVELGKDIGSDYPDLWGKIGQMAVDITRNRENSIYELY